MTRAVNIAFVAPIVALMGGCQPSSPAVYLVPAARTRSSPNAS